MEESGRSDEKPAREFIAEDARIDTLDARLNAAKKRENERNRPQATSADANYSRGNRVLADLLGGILGGLVIGGTIDYFAGTSPWGLLVMLFLGIGVAFRNIFRMASTQSDEPPQE